MNPPASGKGHGILLAACAILILSAFINCHWQVKSGELSLIRNAPIFAPPRIGQVSLLVAPLLGKLTIIALIYGLGRFALHHQVRWLPVAAWILIGFAAVTMIP